MSLRWLTRWEKKAQQRPGLGRVQRRRSKQKEWSRVQVRNRGWVTAGQVWWERHSFLSLEEHIHPQSILRLSKFRKRPSILSPKTNLHCSYDSVPTRPIGPEFWIKHFAASWEEHWKECVSSSLSPASSRLYCHSSKTVLTLLRGYISWVTFKLLDMSY